MEIQRGFGRFGTEGDRQPPPVRPRGLVVLTGLMLVWAIVALHVGLDRLRSLRSDALLPPEAPAGLADDERLQRQLRFALASVHRANPKAMMATAVAHVALSLVLFFAVAAVAMRDPRSRLAAMVAASSGIAFHVGDALLFLFVLRDRYLAEVVPLWVEGIVRQAGDQLDGGQAAELRAFAGTVTVVAHLAMAVCGVVFCGLVLRVFGGRRGRAYQEGLRGTERARRGN